MITDKDRIDFLQQCIEDGEVTCFKPDHAMCSKCTHFGRVTKSGVMFRHGFRQTHRRRTYHGFDLVSGYNAPIIEQACPGSGLPPRNVR